MTSISTDTGEWNGMSLMWRTKAHHHCRLDNWFYKETGIVLRSECSFTKESEWRMLESSSVYTSHKQLRTGI